jgi:hypothetical protein
VTVAALERFADPSRRCEPADDVAEWNLAGLRNHPAAFVRSLPGAAAGWLGGAIPRGERLRVLRACLGTGGARLGALARAPDLWRRVERREVDRLAVFSAKHFPLAGLLAERLGRPPDELLAHGTKYHGEFAFELLAVVPYAYWLHRNGLLDFTISSADTAALYYFSPRHEERPGPRRYVPITEYPAGEGGRLRYDRHAFPAQLDTGRWTPPPYKERFRTDRFGFDRELCVVLNKSSSERYLRRGFAPNSMDTELALEVVGRLRTKYTVVYCRPRAADIVPDHQRIREPGDIEAIGSRHPDVLTIQQLHADNRDLSFNELQLSVLAGAERFVSVLGGGSYLASYFGGTNVVYARRGWEVACGAFDNWFDRFSGARVVAAGTPRDLLTAIERELLRR